MSQEKTQTGSGSGFNFALLVCLLVAGFFIYSLMNLGSIEGRGGLAVGKPAPEIQAAGWVNGSPPDVLSGKVIVVDAWATWCLPCKKKAPDLVETYQKFADRD